MCSALPRKGKVIYGRNIGQGSFRFGTILLSLLVFLAIPAFAQKKVLIISSYDMRTPAIATYDEAIRKTFESNGQHVQFYTDALDDGRFPMGSYGAEFLQLLRKKYGSQKFDCIFALGPPALKLLREHEGDLFAGVPRVYMVLDERSLSGFDLGSNTTGVAGKLEFGPTLDLILAQNPRVRTVAVITGISPLDKSVLETAKQDLTVYEGRVNLQYLSNQTLPELQQELAALPPDSVAYLLSYTADRAGNTYNYPDAASAISPISKVPVYGTVDTGMGAGIVGGSLISFESHGEIGARMALRLMAGESAANIPPVTASNVTMFDGRQLRRWRIDESRLPAGSIVRFKEPTMWEQYSGHIIGIAIFGIFQTLLIAWLLILRERRKQAVRERLSFAAIAEVQHQKLDAVVANVPGVVWESRLEAGTNDRRTEFVSDYVEKMLGYTPEEVAEIPNFWKSVVHKDDQLELFQTTRKILQGRKTAVQQFRCITKDGVTIWVDAHLVPNCDEAGNIVGIRGVAIDVTDRKLAEDDLYKREFELSEAQRLSQIGNWEWDPETDTVRWSEELYRIARIDPRQPAPNWEEHKRIYTPDSYERLAAAVATAMESGAWYELELEMIRSDGSHLWVNARGEVLRDEDFNVIKLRGTLQDISEQKKAEEALTESEERYRNVVETQTELICRYLPDTTLTFVNDAYCRYFGKSREELIGAKFVDFIPLHVREEVLGHIASLVENRGTEMHEHEVVRPDGTRGWHQWINHLVAMPGKPSELQGIGRDITEKRQVEEALRLSENRFRKMADSAPVLIWMCGPDQLCTYVNQGWLDFTGRSLEMELGHGWTAGIHSEDTDRTREAFDSAFDRREPFKVEYRLRSADGDYRWVYSSGTPRFSSESEFLGYIGSCVDISERIENEHALKTALDEVRDLQKQLHEENIYLREVIELKHNFDELIGHSDALKYVLYKIEQLAKTEATVLITGETGTGKELVAKAIHSTSIRKSKPLVTVNCAALSASLIESELFGHERGAFTGASTRKVGRFELADGATIFLDEVGELPSELQAKLLRVIQEGEFERLGSSKTIKVDARIIAATNRNLDAEVKKGAFREDLLFRLNVFPITVPPLRERKEDIPELVEYFANRFSKKVGKKIRTVSPTTIRKLAEYSWPGNVRELANVMERSVINSQGEVLTVFEDFSKAKGDDTSSPITSSTLEAVERKYIEQVLVNSGWRVDGPNGAARILGLHPSTLRTRMSKLNISRKSVSPANPQQ